MSDGYYVKGYTYSPVGTHAVSWAVGGRLTERSLTQLIPLYACQVNFVALPIALHYITIHSQRLI